MLGTVYHIFIFHTRHSRYVCVRIFLYQAIDVSQLRWSRISAVRATSVRPPIPSSRTRSQRATPVDIKDAHNVADFQKALDENAINVSPDRGHRDDEQRLPRFIFICESVGAHAEKPEWQTGAVCCATSVCMPSSAARACKAQFSRMIPGNPFGGSPAG